MDKLYASKVYSDGYVDVTNSENHKVYTHYTTKQIENMFSDRDVYGLSTGKAYNIMEFATEQDMQEHSGLLVDQFYDNGNLYGVFEVPSYESVAYFVGTKKPKESNSNIFITREGFTDRWKIAAKFKDPTEAYKLCNSVNRQRPSEFGVYITGNSIEDDYQLYDEWVQVIHSEVEPKEIRVYRKADIGSTFVVYRFPNNPNEEFQVWLLKNEFFEPTSFTPNHLKNMSRMWAYNPGTDHVMTMLELLKKAEKVKPNPIEVMKCDALVDQDIENKLICNGCTKEYYQDKPRDIYKAEHLTVDRHYMASDGKAAVAPAGYWAVESPECYYEYLNDEDFKRLYMEVK